MKSLGYLIVLVCLTLSWRGVEGLDCYKCESKNGNNKQCEDAPDPSQKETAKDGHYCITVLVTAGAATTFQRKASEHKDNAPAGECKGVKDNGMTVSGCNCATDMCNKQPKSEIEKIKISSGSGRLQGCSALFLALIALVRCFARG